MFARFGTLLIIVFSAVLVFSGTADAAINIDSVGPGSGNLNYGFTGDTLYSQVDCDEPIGIVYWYIRGPGETGLGTLVHTAYGDGTSESSHLSHTFDKGSTSGEEYEITAYVYPDPDAADQTVDWDSYTVSIWTPPEEVITFPDTLTITDDIKIGDNYGFIAEAASSSSNYVIDEIEVFVNGVSAVSHSVYGVTSTSINVSGTLAAEDTMTVRADVKGKLKGGAKWGGKVIAIIIAKQAWRAALRTSLWGDCECAKDGDPLDNKEKLPFWCWVENESGSQGEWVKDTRFNTTIVEYEVLKANNFFIKKKRRVLTSDSGRYIFSHKVPIGYVINVTLVSDDMHYHIDPNHPHICKYKAIEKAVDTGNVTLEVIPKDWGDDIQVNFTVKPDSVHDPCDGAYP